MKNNTFYIPDYSPDELFGPITRIIPAELSYIYLWKQVETDLLQKLGSNRAFFLPGSLSEFRDYFLHASSKFWFPVFDPAIRESCGDMDIEWKKWLSEKVIPKLPDIHEKLCNEFEVYKYQTDLLVQFSITNILEIIDDFIDFSENIQNILFPDDMPRDSKILKIHLTDSDRHNYGKTVVIFEYDDHRKVVRKPQNMKIYRAWDEWLNLLAECADSKPFPRIKSFDTETGAFCSYIEYAPLCQKEDVSSFYWKAGFILGAVFLLEGTDFHNDNIIAYGSDLFLIDAESIIYVKTDESVPVRPSYAIENTGFLPFLCSGPGLYPGSSSLYPYKPSKKCFPSFDGEYYDAYNYKDMVLLGFKKALSVFEENKHFMSEKAAELFEGCSFRYLIKTTAFYDSVRAILSSPQNLRSIANQNEALSLLDHWASFDAASSEKKALINLDIPAFYHTISSSDSIILKERLLFFDKNVIGKASDEIEFLLSKYNASDAIPVEKKCLKTRLNINAIKNSVYKLCDMLENDRCVFVQRNDLELYISHPFISLLEGTLGAVIALSQWKKISGDNRADNILSDFFEKMESSKHLFSVGITASETGLCEGTGGFLLGLIFLKEAGLISESLYFDYLSKINDLDFTDVNGNCSLGYGYAGLVYALGKLPAETLARFTSLRASLESLTAHLSSYVESIPDDNDMIFGKKGILFAIGKKKWEDCFDTENDKTALTDNMSLINGMAGMLYSSTSTQNPSSDSIALALLDAVKPESPNHMCVPGLLWGESGKIYAFLRYLYPEIVPSIF